MPETRGGGAAPHLDTLTPDGPSDYDRLVRFVVAPGPGFAIAVAVFVGRLSRDRVIRQAVAEAGRLGASVEVLDVSEVGPDGDLLARLSRAAEPGETRADDSHRSMFVTGIEALLVDPLDRSIAGGAIEQLNRSRDLLPAQVPTRLVLWMTPPARTEFLRRARDVADVVLHWFEFGETCPPRFHANFRETPGNRLVPSPDSPDRLQREAALLRQLLSSAGTSEAVRLESRARLGQISAQLGDWQAGAAELLECSASMASAGRIDDAVAVAVQASDVQAAHGAGRDALVTAMTARALADGAPERTRVVAAGRVADLMFHFGRIDEAVRVWRDEQLPAYERMGDAREEAVVRAKLADALDVQGESDEALRILREDVLPRLEQIGDAVGCAVTHGNIANILLAKGRLDEALQELRDRALPSLEGADQIRERAVVLGKIAYVLLARGQADDALSLLRNDVLPVFERLGDPSPVAVTQGRIADVLAVIGEVDESIRIRREIELPAYERLGDVRALAIGRAMLALGLIARGQPEADRPEVVRLLGDALRDARRLGLPEATQIEGLLHGLGAPVEWLDRPSLDPSTSGALPESSVREAGAAYTAPPTGDLTKPGP